MFPVMPTVHICLITLRNTLSTLMMVYFLDKEIWEPQENSATKENIPVEITMFCDSDGRVSVNETYWLVIVLGLCKAPAEMLPWLSLGTPQLLDLAKGLMHHWW